MHYETFGGPLTCMIIVLTHPCSMRTRLLTYTYKTMKISAQFLVVPWCCTDAIITAFC